MALIQSKQEYREILDKTITQTEEYVAMSPTMGLYQVILKQLTYIKDIVVEKGRIPTQEEKEMISIGPIAVRNFDDYGDDPYSRAL
jgi:hypothetical protein